MNALTRSAARGRASVFGALFKKELLENIRNFRFPLALGLCLVIIPLGFIIAQQDYIARQRVYDGLVANYEQSHRTLFDVLTSGGAAFRQPARLAFLSAGVELLIPNSAETRGHVNLESRVQDMNSRRQDNPFAFLFGRLDLAFIVSTVLGVFVMIFSFNAVAGERERGTLAQIMSNAVPRPAIIAAKMAAGFFMLALAFLAGILAGTVLVSALGLAPYKGPGTTSSFMIGIGVSLVFLIVLYGLGLLVSSLNRNSISAMLALLSLWVTLVMLIPKGSVAAAKLFRPIRSQQVIDLEKSQVRRQNELELRGEIKKLTLSFPGIENAARTSEDRARAASFVELQEKFKHEYKSALNAELDRIDVDFTRQKTRRAALARNLSRLSPVSCLVHILTELAGTGFLADEQWQKTRSRLEDMIEREITAKVQVIDFITNDRSSGAQVREYFDRQAAAPDVRPSPIPLSRVLGAIWIDLLLLILYGIIAFSAAYTAFLKYDVR